LASPRISGGQESVEQRRQGSDLGDETQRADRLRRRGPLYHPRETSR